MITLQSFMEELWAEPAVRWTVYMTILAFVWYWLFTAIYESLDRQRVVEAADRWAENKRRRDQKEQVEMDLWDSVNQLKKGQKHDHRHC